MRSAREEQGRRVGHERILNWKARTVLLGRRVVTVDPRAP